MNAPEPQAEMEASDFGRFEPTPYDLGISDDPEVGWADIQPGEREFCAQDAASYPERGLDVFGGPLPDAQAPEPEAEL